LDGVVTYSRLLNQKKAKTGGMDCEENLPAIQEKEEENPWLLDQKQE